MRWFGRLLLGLVFLVGLALVGGWLYLRTSLPQTSGQIRLAGLDGPVTIVRDADGVAHIRATTDRDAYFAQGYVHAQDRLWQMEMNRRIGHGRLSEVLGQATVDTDKFLRTLGVSRAAQEAWEYLDPQVQEALQAYAQGVNAWLEQGRTLPPEFLILGVEPEPWSVYDSLVWAKMMAWDLGGNYDVELLRAKLIQALGPERTGQILPPYPEDGVDIVDAETLGLWDIQGAEALLALDSQLQEMTGLGGLDVGSNNWVVAGSRTATGMPMLANDPHLAASIPSIWYLNELKGRELHVTGASLPGLPGVVIGHNGRIAWGVTNVNPDVQDLYVERINPQNPNQYEVNGEWVDMEIVEEWIYVKGEEEPIRWAARSTRHGPLISDVLEDATAPLALRWTALDPDDTTFAAFYWLNRATDWESFLDALRLYVVPSQNFVYADVDGNIGYIAPGRIPIRAQGDGTLPVPGWTDDHEWIGFIPFDELPQVFNPPSGYVVTANNRVVDERYPYLLSTDWAPPYRAQRIVELIQEGSADGTGLTLEDMVRIQADQRSSQTAELLPWLLQVPPRDERQEQALSALRSWDGVASRESVATTIYEAWFIHLGMAMFQDELRGDLYEEMARRAHPLFLHQVLSAPERYAGWCDDVLTPAQESCIETAQNALDAALDELSDRFGPTMSRWRWGSVHRTQYPHRPFSQVPFLRWLFHRSIENGGDTYTVNVAPVRVHQRYDQFHVPSYRQIVDLADPGNSLFMTTTGQSGNPLSGHYDDLIRRHRDVEYLPMPFDEEPVEGDRLELLPSP